MILNYNKGTRRGKFCIKIYLLYNSNHLQNLPFQKFFHLLFNHLNFLKSL